MLLSKTFPSLSCVEEEWLGVTVHVENMVGLGLVPVNKPLGFSSDIDISIEKNCGVFHPIVNKIGHSHMDFICPVQ